MKTLNLPKKFLALCLAAVVSLSATGSANAGSLYEAMGELEKGSADKAAAQLFEIYEREQNLDTKREAEFYLAQALEKKGLLISALFFYSQVFKQGAVHKHYFAATAGMVELARRLKDDFIVPRIINDNWDTNALRSLSKPQQQAVNYMIGQLYYRQGKLEDAKAYLSAVPEGYEAFARAHYSLGSIYALTGKNEEAIKVWQQLLDTMKDPDTLSDDQKTIRNFAILGQARANYALGKYREATELYRSVPRYSNEWYDALFENSWSYFVQEEYGRALGEVESVLSPYFNKRFRPEAYVVAATVYYSNCQFDRARLVLDSFKNRYEVAQDELKKYIASSRSEREFYQDLVRTNPAIPEEILRQVRRNGRFLNYHRTIVQIMKEQEIVAAADNWRSSRLGAELGSILRDQLETFEKGTGEWVKRSLATQSANLNQFINQARFLKLETATSEKEVLEAGGDIKAKERKRLPRPDIPNDQYQHWNFKGEYWVDEIGYLVHSVRKECTE